MTDQAAPPIAAATPALPTAPRVPDGLDTPSLVIDLDIVEANAQRMAAAVGAQGIALRPHVKTHKSVALAKIQLAAGARGITVGTLGEAEVMVEGGVGDIFLAYPLWADAAKTERLRRLVARPGLKFAVAVDSVAGAERLAASVGNLDRPLRVLVEVNPNYGRTGVGAESAGEVALAAKGFGLDVVGVFTHGGHVYARLDAREQAGADEVEALSAAVKSLRTEGIRAEIISAGASPTITEVSREPINEVRPGTYLIGDRMQVALGSSPPDGVAIAVAATVVSTTVPGQVVINAGAKSLTKDVAPYLTGHGFLPAYPEGRIERVTDYHGEVRFPEGASRPALGEVVAVVPNHACPVIDLYDTFVATRSGAVVGRWAVDARGRSG